MGGERFIFSELTAADRETGLVWTRDANIAGRFMLWSDANNYIRELTRQRYAGYSDWRLPTIEELKNTSILCRKPLLTSDITLGAELIEEAMAGNIEKVNDLLARGADANAKNNAGETALMWASESGHSGVVEALLNKGTDVNAKANNGTTALMLAWQYRHRIAENAWGARLR